MKAARACAAAVLLATTSVAGAAPQRLDESGIREAVHSYAVCLARKATRSARAFVLGDARFPPRVVDCVPGDVNALRFPGENYRYALAEALVQVDFPRGVPAGAAQVPQIDHGVRPSSNADRAARAARDPGYKARLDEADMVWSLGVIGDCVAHSDPAGAFALTRSEGDSAEENAAIATLRPALAGCLPAGATVRINRASLRGPVALYLYRMAVRAGGGAR